MYAPSKEEFLVQTCAEASQGRVLWLTPVIPELWEAKAGRSVEARTLGPAWLTW